MTKYLKIAGFAAALSLPWSVRAQQEADQNRPAPAPQWDSIRTWFKHFKEGLESSSVSRYQRHNVGVTAVAAVRGAQQKLDDPKKPYVKGKMDSKRQAQLSKERAELSSAIDLVLAGNLDEGSKKLDAFEAAHPKSLFLSDVRKAREQIAALKSATPPGASESATPAAAPAAPDAPTKP